MQALTRRALTAGRPLAGTLSRNGGAAQQRSVVTFIDSYEKPNWEVSEFVSYSNSCGQDEYPFYRKEYLMPSEKRKMRANRADGRVSNKNVRGLVKFIQLKQDMKYV